VGVLGDHPGHQALHRRFVRRALRGAGCGDQKDQDSEYPIRVDGEQATRL